MSRLPSSVYPELSISWEKNLDGMLREKRPSLTRLSTSCDLWVCPRYVLSTFQRDVAHQKGTDLKWSEIRKNQGTKTFLGLKPDEAALYSRAQFTPEEVGNLRTQFEQMDFVSHQRPFDGHETDE
jgi:hypothetical protein